MYKTNILKKKIVLQLSVVKITLIIHVTNIIIAKFTLDWIVSLLHSVAFLEVGLAWDSTSKVNVSPLECETHMARVEPTFRTTLLLCLQT